MRRFVSGLLALSAVCTVAVLCLALPVPPPPPTRPAHRKPPSRRMTRDAAAKDEGKPTRRLRQTQEPRTRLLPAPARFSPG